NALAKRAGDSLALLWWAGVLGIILYLPPSLYVLLGTGFPKAALPYVLATSVLHAVYFFALSRAYRSGDYSIVYPVARGLGVALVPFLAFGILGERLSPLGALGVGLVVVGIFALHWRSIGATLLAPGTLWAVATGITIATYSLVDKAGVTRLHPLPY